MTLSRRWCFRRAPAWGKLLRRRDSFNASTGNHLTMYLLLARSLARDNSCRLALAVFDGRRRYDLRFSDLAPEALAGFAGPAKVCRICAGVSGRSGRKGRNRPGQTLVRALSAGMQISNHRPREASGCGRAEAGTRRPYENPEFGPRLDRVLAGRRRNARLRRFCRSLVRRHRQKIEAVAGALLVNRTLRTDKQVRLAAGLPPRLRRLSQAEAYRR